MPRTKSKLQQITLEFHIDIANMSKKEAEELGEYIQDYVVEHYNTINCDYEVIDGE